MTRKYKYETHEMDILAMNGKLTMDYLNAFAEHHHSIIDIQSDDFIIIKDYDCLESEHAYVFGRDGNDVSIQQKRFGQGYCL